MDKFQTAFESLLKEELGFPKFALELIDDRLRDRGIRLTRAQRMALKSRLKDLGPDDLSLALKITDVQLAGSTLTEEERATGKISLDIDAERILSAAEEAIPTIVVDFIERGSGLMWKKLTRETRMRLRAERREQRGFETRLAKRWGGAIDRLELMRQLAVEAGSAFNTESRPEAEASRDFVFEVLTRLHARAYQVSSEVITLLRSGHADGAHARWRCLHEIAVVGFFVREHGNDVAERYILHDAIESYRAALSYQRHCKKLGYEPFTDAEFSQIAAARDALKGRFGDSYTEQYGWAAEALHNKNPNFSDIEEKVGLAHLRPYYKLASHNVHANPKGAFFKLGLLPGAQMLLAGPSDLGLADPGHGTAISLAQITFTLLTMKPNIDRLVMCRILERLEREVGEAFLEAHQAIEGRDADSPQA